MKMSNEILKTIEEKLNEIEQKEDVKILHCVESGSRAWGFASPDSDYDVRFIYVRKADWYLKLDGGRDVIEWQLDDVLDINGWDLQKTLKLLHNSNPTVFEWDKSPIVYRSTPEWKSISDKMKNWFSVNKMLHHYLGIAVGQYNRNLKGDEIKLKKYFYVLRPILACEWIADRKIAPPVLFEELKAAYLPKEYADIVDNLIARKKAIGEMETEKKNPVLDEYLTDRLQYFTEYVKNVEKDDPKDWEELNKLFRQNIKGE